MTRARTLLSVIAMLSLLATLNARIVRPWTYQEMFDKADLVVIASRVSTKDTKERSTLKDLEPHVEVVGVVTEFKTLLVLKGSREIKTFRLHHYRFRHEEDEMAANSPDLLRLSEGHLPFLMFLTKEENGRYAPVTGQTDPATFSVMELRGAAH